MTIQTSSLLVRNHILRTWIVSVLRSISEYIEYAQPDLFSPGEWCYWTKVRASLGSLSAPHASYPFTFYQNPKWYGFPDNENNLQLASDMTNSSNIVTAFWRDVGEEKMNLSQYTSEQLTTLKLRSSLTWRSKLPFPRFNFGLFFNSTFSVFWTLCLAFFLQGGVRRKRDASRHKAMWNTPR